MEHQREGRSLSIQHDLNQSSQNFADDVAGSVDNNGKTAAAAAAAGGDLVHDRDNDEEEDLSYDEQDSVGEHSVIPLRPVRLSVRPVPSIYWILTRQRNLTFSRDNLSDTHKYLNNFKVKGLLERNAAVTFARLWSSCTNRIVMHLRQLSLFSV